MAEQKSQSSPNGTDTHRSLPRNVRAWLRDPARCFLLLGVLGGLLLIAILPPFAGIDEPAHFVRAYQVSTGRLVPETPPGQSEGGGACIPVEVARDVGRHVRDYYRHITETQDLLPGFTPTGTPVVGVRRGCPPDERFVDFSAFGWNSPILYAPEALTIAIFRPFGVGTTALSYLSRLAGLAVYLGLVFVAIRRSPFARWGLVALGLAPVALFQAGSGRSPDLMTTGVGMLVVVAALRAVRGGTDAVEGSTLAERTGLCVLLGLLKPTYAVLAACFLLPLAGPRRSRLDSLPAMVLPVGAAITASVLWQVYAAHFFVCDTVFFGFGPDPGAQRTQVLEQPFRYAGEVLASFWTYAGDYLREAVTIGETVANWHWLGIALAVGALVLAGSRRDATERFSLTRTQRALLLGIAFVGMVMLITGEHIYCAPVGIDVVYPPHARHFVPVLIPAVVALTPSREARSTGSWSEAIPSALLLLAVTLAFLGTMALEVR